MLGLTIATLIGVPIAAWLGQVWGWRAAFVFVGALAILAAILIFRELPEIPAEADASPLRELGALKRPQVWLTLAIGAIGFGGLFSVFSYVKPTMMELAGMSLEQIPVVLALFGVGMVLGNIVGPRLADRALMPTMCGLLIWGALVLGAYSFTAYHPWLGALNVLLVGTLVALGPVLQLRLMDVAGDAQTLAAALNHSAFNAANALGAWLGGVVVTAGFGWAATGWIGTLLALAGLVVFAISVMAARREQAR